MDLRLQVCALKVLSYHLEFCLSLESIFQVACQILLRTVAHLQVREEVVVSPLSFLLPHLRVRHRAAAAAICYKDNLQTDLHRQVNNAKKWPKQLRPL